MLPCTLHLGMPKAGSTSIQDALFYHLDPPGFQYAGFGEPNGSWGVGAVFWEQPHVQASLRERRATQGLARRQQTMLARFQRSVHRARRHRRHLIVSAELLYCSSTESNERLRRFLNDRGFEVHALAYMRPWRSYMQGRLQQRLKNGRNHLSLEFKDPFPHLDCRGRIESFWQVYGQDRVTFVPFRPADFPNQCVVEDFCQRLGVPLRGTTIPRKNESLSLAATRLIFAYNRFSPHQIAEDRIRPRRYWLLADRLATLAGPSFQLHSSFFAPIHRRVEADLEWIEQQLGFSMDENLARYDEGPCIRCEDDLLDFEDEALEWLARETGQRVIRRTNRDDTARAVAAQMERLRTRLPSLDEVAEWMKTRWSDPYIRWRYHR